MERGIINRPPRLLASPDLNGHLHGPEFREIAGKLKKRKGVFYTKIPKLRQIWSKELGQLFRRDSCDGPDSGKVSGQDSNVFVNLRSQRPDNAVRAAPT